MSFVDGCWATSLLTKQLIRLDTTRYHTNPKMITVTGCVAHECNDTKRPYELRYCFSFFLSLMRFEGVMWRVVHHLRGYVVEERGICTSDFSLQ